MSRSELSIELADAEAVFISGEAIRGWVKLAATESFSCRQLVLRSLWRDEVAGDTDTHRLAELQLFSGELASGETRQLAFELRAPAWPPTYRGLESRVEHLLEAQAELVGQGVLRREQPIEILGGQPPLQQQYAASSESNIASTVVSMVITAFFVLSALPLGVGRLAIIITLLALAFLAVMLHALLTRWLPRLYVGPGELLVQSTRLSPQQTLRGYLELRPGRRIRPQFVRVQLVCSELIASPSDKEETIHRNDVYQCALVDLAPSALPGGSAARFDFDTLMPPLAAYSMSAGLFQVRWTLQASVGIPGLATWQRQLALHVVPPSDLAELRQLGSPLEQILFAGDGSPAGRGVEGDSGELTLAETARVVWNHRDEPQVVAELVEAVAELPLRATVQVQRRLLRGSPEDVCMRDDEQLVLAQHTDPPLPLSLCIPKRCGSRFDALAGSTWAGQVQVLGWDRRGGRLQLRMLGDAESEALG